MILHALKRQQHRGLDLLFAWRRLWFITRIRALAAVQRTHVDLEIGPGLRLGRRIAIKVAPRSNVRVRLGRGCLLGDDVLLLLTKGSFWCGDGVQLRRSNVVNVVGDLRLEGRNILSYGTIVHCAEKLHLGMYTGCGEYATLVDSTHYHSEPDVCISDNTMTAPVVIGENVFICPRATVNRGVTVGDYAIVGPNSVVSKDVPRATFVSGVPAKVIRAIDLPWEDPMPIVESVLAETS